MIIFTDNKSAKRYQITLRITEFMHKRKVVPFFLPHGEPSDVATTVAMCCVQFTPPSPTRRDATRQNSSVESRLAVWIESATVYGNLQEFQQFVIYRIMLGVTFSCLMKMAIPLADGSGRVAVAQRYMPVCIIAICYSDKEQRSGLKSSWGESSRIQFTPPTRRNRTVLSRRGSAVWIGHKTTYSSATKQRTMW